MAAGQSTGIRDGILKFGQMDNVSSSKTTYDWKIDRFDVEFCPIHYEPGDGYSDEDEDLGLDRPTHELRKKLVSKKFLAGEEAGCKSSWRMELNYVYARELVGISSLSGKKEFEVSLVLDEYLGSVGSEKSWKPFRCHAKISMIEPETFRLVEKFYPELHTVTMMGAPQRMSFRNAGDAMLEKLNNVGAQVVKATICLSVELEIFGENYSAPYDFLRGGEENGAIQLQQDFGNLLNCKESSDFTIKCDGKDFSVHKTILWGRSKVFARMFSHPGFKECQENTIEVTDIAQDTMEILLHYIYTGKLSELKDCDNLEGVIRGADKYELSELKDYCFQNLIQSITEENFGPLAYFATSCNAGERVLTILKRFYERNVLKLMKNVEFRKLAGQLPEAVFGN